MFSPKDWRKANPDKVLAINRRYREKHPDQYKKWSRTKLENRAKRFLDYKSTLKCLTCGENDPICLDFHHEGNEKAEGGVARLATHSSWNKVMEEVNKCVVLCSNCHRKKHRDEKGKK